MPYVLTSNTTKGLEDTIVHIKDIQQEVSASHSTHQTMATKKTKR